MRLRRVEFVGVHLGEAGEAEALELDAHDGLELLDCEGLVGPTQRAVLRDGAEVRWREVDARLEVLRPAAGAGRLAELGCWLVWG